MTLTPGSARNASTTAPAGSRETQNRVMPGPRIVAREFSRLFDKHGMDVHPANVRALAHRFCAMGKPMSEVEACVLAYADPTGEKAARNVDRERRGGGPSA